MTASRSFCRICEVSCGSLVELTSEGVRISPDRDNPYSSGYFCRKGLRADFIEEDSDRLRQPRIRRNGELETSSWSEAFEYLAPRLRDIAERYGTNSIGVFSGNSAAYSGHLTLAISRLMRGLETDSLFSALSIDCISRYYVTSECLGLLFATPVPLYRSISGMLLLGSNATVNQWSPGGATPGGARIARDMQSRGGWLGVVDPVRHPIARLADEYYSIRPGTNATFLAGLLAHLAREGAVDDGYVDRHCLGLRGIIERCEHVGVDDVADTCGLSAREVQQLFTSVVRNRAAVVDRGGITMSRHSTVSSGLTLAINASMGLIDDQAGFFVPDYSPVRGRATPGRPDGIRYGKEWPSAVLASAIDGGDRPAGFEAVPDIKALISVAGNPARSLPSSTRVRKALRSLDLLVVVDLYVTDTAVLADVVLPGTSQYQRNDFNFLSALLTPERYRAWSDQIVPVQHQEKPELWIADRLIQAVNGEAVDLDDDDFRDFLVGRTEEPADQWMGGATDTPEVGKYLSDGFPTASGRIEFDRPWAEAIPDALAEERERTSDGEAFTVVGRRIGHSVNSFLHNVPHFAELGNPAFLAPEEAARLQLVEGDAVELQTASGSTEAVIALSEDVPRGTISMSHGWGHKETLDMSNAALARGGNANALTSDLDLDPFTGMPIYHGYEVRVVKQVT